MEAYQQLHQFVQQLATFSVPTNSHLQHQAGNQFNQHFNVPLPASHLTQPQQNELNVLLSRCYLKLGNWKEQLEGINEQSIPHILQYYAAATERDRDW